MLDADGHQGPPHRARLARLRLVNFRNYASLDTSFDGRSVVLTGANGAGKTNLLEAISLLAPGRGLRRANRDEIANEHGDTSWVVSADVEAGDGLIHIGTGHTALEEERASSRQLRIDRQPHRSTTALSAHLAVLWLTPELDGLFRGPPGERRRFLDRLAGALEPNHRSQVTAYERLSKERNRLLGESNGDPAWLSAVEREMAAAAMPVVLTRLSAVERLGETLQAERDPASPFPWAELALTGQLEEWILTKTSAEAETAFRHMLNERRSLDRSAGRATLGPQASDLVVRHGPKGILAARASTGEQKALLVGLILAQTRLVADATRRLPLLLLDEAAAHLDAARRAGLYEAISRLGCQAFLTGTDPSMFTALAGEAEHFEVSQGCLRQR